MRSACAGGLYMGRRSRRTNGARWRMIWAWRMSSREQCDGDTRGTLICKQYEKRHRAVVVINCRPEFDRRRGGGLRFRVRRRERTKGGRAEAGPRREGQAAIRETDARGDSCGAGRLDGQQVEALRGKVKPEAHAVSRLIERLPRSEPRAHAGVCATGRIFVLFCYFLSDAEQYSRDGFIRVKNTCRVARGEIEVIAPERCRRSALHPDAGEIFASLPNTAVYATRQEFESSGARARKTASASMLPQIVSGTHKHSTRCSARRSRGLAGCRAFDVHGHREAAKVFVSRKRWKEVGKSRGVRKKQKVRIRTDTADNSRAAKRRAPRVRV